MGESERESGRFEPTQAMLYPNEYTWLVFVSTMDIMLTWVILKYEGQEVNPIARLVIEYWGLQGAILFKYSLMLFVIIACDVVGRQKSLRYGRNLVRLAVVVSGIPMIYSLTLLYRADIQPEFPIDPALLFGWIGPFGGS